MGHHSLLDTVIRPNYAGGIRFLGPLIVPRLLLRALLMTIASQAESAKRPTSRRQKWIMRLSASALGTVVALAIAEVGLRLFVDQETKRLAVYDPDLGWRGRPGGRGVYIRSADDIRVPFRYNNLGFRDEDVGAKAENERRLMLVGDSFIENLEVEYPRTFPALIEAGLQERPDPWSVATVGSQGYSTAQELRAFRKYAGQVDPDWVLLFFYCGNDFEDNQRHNFAFLDENQKLQLPENKEATWKIQSKRFQRWLYESSHVVFLLKNKLQSVTEIEIAPASKSVAEADETYKREITSQLLSQMAADVRAFGVPFGVVVIPFRDDLVAGRHERRQFVTETCRQHDIPCLDLGEHVGQDDYFETDVHFNDQGHQRVSQAVLTFLDRHDAVALADATQ